jgi:hypothetical protein
LRMRSQATFPQFSIYPNFGCGAPTGFEYNRCACFGASPERIP